MGQVPIWNPMCLSCGLLFIFKKGFDSWRTNAPVVRVKNRDPDKFYGCKHYPTGLPDNIYFGDEKCQLYEERKIEEYYVDGNMTTRKSVQSSGWATTVFANIVYFIIIGVIVLGIGYCLFAPSEPYHIPRDMEEEYLLP